MYSLSALVWTAIIVAILFYAMGYLVSWVHESQYRNREFKKYQNKKS